MANTASAAKQARASVRRREGNRFAKERFKGLEKNYRRLVASGQLAEARELLPQVVSACDRAAKRAVIHRNTASRKASRLALLLKRAEQAPAPEEKKPAKAPRAAKAKKS